MPGVWYKSSIKSNISLLIINILDNSEDVEKVLAVVVRRRKTIPQKCMKIFNKMTELELIQLVSITPFKCEAFCFWKNLHDYYWL